MGREMNGSKTRIGDRRLGNRTREAKNQLS